MSFFCFTLYQEKLIKVSILKKLIFSNFKSCLTLVWILGLSCYLSLPWKARSQFGCWSREQIFYLWSYSWYILDLLIRDFTSSSNTLSFKALSIIKIKSTYKRSDVCLVILSYTHAYSYSITSHSYDRFCKT